MSTVWKSREFRCKAARNLSGLDAKCFIFRWKHIPLKNHIGQKLFSRNVFSMLHIGQNTFNKIISWKYKLGHFYFSVWRCDFFVTRPITHSTWLHNRTGGCRGLPLLSHRCATKGSTEVSNPLVSVGGLGGQRPLIICRNTFFEIIYRRHLQTLKVTPPNPLYWFLMNVWCCYTSVKAHSLNESN